MVKVMDKEIVKEPVKENRKMDRRIFSYYLPVTEAESIQQIGVMTDISLGGFKLDSRGPIPNGQVNYFRLSLTPDISSRASLVFAGRSKWCHRDLVDPSVFNVGFEIVDLAPEDKPIYQLLFDKYGLKNNGLADRRTDFVWR
jgi:hypothetical protein